MSPGSKAGITSFTRDQVHDETQPLGVGHVADGGGYHSTSTIRVQSLMPVDRHSRGNSGVADSEEGDSGTLGVGGDLAYELETPRVSRGPSTAYDLSDMSTEDEVRVRACIFERVCRSLGGACLAMPFSSGRAIFM